MCGEFLHTGNLQSMIESVMQQKLARDSRRRQCWKRCNTEGASSMGTADSSVGALPGGRMSKLAQQQKFRDQQLTWSLSRPVVAY